MVTVVGFLRKLRNVLAVGLPVLVLSRTACCSIGVWYFDGTIQRDLSWVEMIWLRVTKLSWAVLVEVN